MTSEHLSIQVENGDEEERESSTDAITSLDGAENVREEVQEEVQEEKQSGSLSQLCTDKDLIEIAKELNDWETLWASLSITEPEVREIKKDCQADYLAQKINVLMRWKKKCRSSATFAALSKVFRAAGNALLADSIEEKSLKSMKRKEAFLYSRPTRNEVLTIAPMLSESWVLIGKAVGLSNNEVDEIFSAEKNNANRCIAMLQKWLNIKPDVTWDDLLNILYMPCFKLKREATWVKNKLSIASKNVASTKAKPTELDNEYSSMISRVYKYLNSNPEEFKQVCIKLEFTETIISTGLDPNDSDNTDSPHNFLSALRRYEVISQVDVSWLEYLLKDLPDCRKFVEEYVNFLSHHNDQMVGNIPFVDEHCLPSGSYVSARVDELPEVVRYQSVRKSKSAVKGLYNLQDCDMFPGPSGVGSTIFYWRVPFQICQQLLFPKTISNDLKSLIDDAKISEFQIILGDAKTVMKVKDFAVVKPVQSPMQVAEQLSSGIHSFSEDLREMYLKMKQPVLPDEANWPLNLQPSFCVDSVVCHRGYKSQKSLIRLSKPWVKNMEIWNPNSQSFLTPAGLLLSSPANSKPPKAILVESQCSMTRHMFTNEIAYKWAAGEILQDKQLLLYFNFCDPRLSFVSTLHQFLSLFTHGNMEVASCIKRSMAGSHGKNVMLLIDGCDDYLTNSMLPFITNVFKGKASFNATLLVTSSPLAAPHASFISLFDMRLKLFGLTKEDRNNQMTRSLQSKGLVNNLYGYFNQHPIINDLCFSPCFLAVVLWMFRQGDLPQSLTGLCEAFVLSTICHNLKNCEQQSLGSAVKRLSDMPEPVLSVVKKIGYLAFSSLKQAKKIFTCEDIKQYCPEITNTADSYGLLSAVCCISSNPDDVCFEFLPGNLQDFLAAFYISCLPSESQLLKLRRCFWDDRLAIMWTMFAGIVGVESSSFTEYIANCDVIVAGQKHFSKQKLTDKRKLLQLYQCFVESNNSDEIPNTLSGIFYNDCIDLHGLSLLPHHAFFLISFMVTSSTRWRSLNLEECNLGDFGMLILERFFATYEAQTASIEHIYIFGNGLFSIQNAYCNIISNGFLQQLNMSNKKLRMNFVLKLADLMKYNTTIRSLNISHNNFAGAGADAFAQCLRRNETLQSLNIAGNKIGVNGASAIASALSHNTTLRKLDASRNDFSDSGAMVFGKCLKQNSTIKDLNVSWNNISSKGAQEIASALDPNSFFVERDVIKFIQHRQYYYKTTRPLFNSSLQSLDISHNYIGDSGAEALGSTLMSNLTLKELDVSSAGLSDVGIQSISTSLKYNASLQQLYLSGNKITKSLAVEEMILSNKALNTLDLQTHHCSDSFSYNMAILEAIHSNHKLRSLGLPKTNGETAVKKAIENINSTRRVLNVQCLMVSFYT